jgi:hypothetical protein
VAIVANANVVSCLGLARCRMSDAVALLVVVVVTEKVLVKGVAEHCLF